MARPSAVAVQLDTVLDEQFEALTCAFQQDERHALMRQALEPAKQAPFVVDDQRRGLLRHCHRIEETDPGVMLGAATEGRLNRGRVRLDQRVEHVVHCRPGAQRMVDAALADEAAMMRAEAVEVLQFVTQGNDRLRAAIEHGKHRCRQLMGLIDDDVGVAAVNHMIRQRQQFHPVIVTHRQLDVPRRRTNQLLPVQTGLFQQHLLIQRRGARPGPGQMVQLQLGIGTVAERAHGADAQGDHITRSERPYVGDGQPAHHLRVLRAP